MKRTQCTCIILREGGIPRLRGRAVSFPQVETVCISVALGRLLVFQSRTVSQERTLLFLNASVRPFVRGGLASASKRNLRVERLSRGSERRSRARTKRGGFRDFSSRVTDRRDYGFVADYVLTDTSLYGDSALIISERICVRIESDQLRIELFRMLISHCGEGAAGRKLRRGGRRRRRRRRSRSRRSRRRRRKKKKRERCRGHRRKEKVADQKDDSSRISNCVQASE